MRRRGAKDMQRRLTVVHVITDLDTGGAEMMLERLLPALGRAGVDNTVISLTTPGPVGARIAASGTPVFSLGLHPSRPNPLALGRLWRLLRRTRADVVQTWLYHADFAGLIAGLAARVPSIVWNIRCADLDPRDHPRSLMPMLRLLAFASRLPAAVICNSEAGRREHERLGYTPKRWAIIPNGFDTDRFAPSAAARDRLRATLGVLPTTRVIGLLARYHPMKDHATFLRAARIILERRDDACVVAAGRGVPESLELKTLVRELGLTGRVHLLDELSEPAAFLAALDVAVSSSYSEAFPNVVAEAMACGTVCVATDVGESSTIVGDTGAVVPARDPEALAEAVLRQLALSPAERQSRGEAARSRIVREFSLDGAGARYRALYDSLTPGPRIHHEASACAE
jgi:glycosyltransferase involved in cell wall biosynthesis